MNASWETTCEKRIQMPGFTGIFPYGREKNYFLIT